MLFHCLVISLYNNIKFKTLTLGWGKNSLSNVRSPEMQYLELPLSSWDQCLRVYGSSGALDSQKSIGKLHANNNLKEYFEK